MVASSGARVSLCMIVRDEAHQLAACLQPVAHLVDEIIIVDTGSQDQTLDVARRFTPYVYDFAWCDDFAAARNESLRRATGDWVLWLDADDRLDEPNIERLKRLLKTLNDEPRVFLMDTLCVAANTDDSSLVVTHQRLFPRHPQLRWRGRVHEQLDPHPQLLGIPWEWTDVQIEHHGYLDLDERHRKLRRKLRLLRMDYAVDPDNHSTLFHLGLAYLKVGTTTEAKRYFEQLVAIHREGQPFMRQVYAALGDIYLYEGRLMDVERIVALGLGQFPDDEGLLFTLGQALFTNQRYGDAAALFETIGILPSIRRMQFCGTSDIREKLAPRMLGSIRRMQGDYVGAESAFGSVLNKFPRDKTTWYNLGLVYLEAGDGGRLQGVIHALRAISSGEHDAKLLEALWQIRHGDVRVAGPLIDELVAEQPDKPCPRMLRAEWLSRVGAPVRDQLRALNDLLRVQPGNLEARSFRDLLQSAMVQESPPVVNSWPAGKVVMAGAANS